VFRDILLVSVAGSVLAIDQLAKYFLTHSLRPNETVPLIKNIFHITLVLNTGCAFGLFKDNCGLLFLGLSAAAVIFLAWFLARFKKDSVMRMAILLLIAGTLSNLIDRVRFGHVIDFLDFRVWPVFNLGDSAITIGVTLFIFSLLKVKSQKEKVKTKS
jgi:signal peptidase II